ncbi:MAG: hypothetical protein JJU15_14070 [Pararhodobacter sp.]|nr:hypothetical protein [Pararhodobacter sp.]
MTPLALEARPELGAPILPPSQGFTLARPGPEDAALLTEWRATYAIEALGEPAATARRSAAETVEQWQRISSHRLLWRDGQPVAVAGFNADLGDAVQVGGVFCPLALRGQGFARLAVALHLAEARDRGATKAVLFAASTPAARAYRAIGFQPAGAITLLLFSNPQEVAPCP